MGRIKLIHYHTNTKDAVPAAENLALGEIAVNTNPESCGLFVKSSNGEVVKISSDNAKFRRVYFSDDNANYTTIEPNSGALSSNKGYVHSFLVWKEGGDSKTPVFSAGNFSSGLFFGLDDTKGAISLAYNTPKIIFSANSCTDKNTPAWTLGLTGAYFTTYDLENFTAATAKKTSGTLSIADQSFNGSADLAIDKLDCGEF